MPMDVNNPYFRTKVLTASPEELRLMLLDGFLRFTRDGRDAIEKKNYEGVYENFTNARNILVELMNGLRHDIAPDLCARLHGLYIYMFNKLIEGSFEKDVSKVDEVIRLMEFERETWVMLMQKIAEERGTPNTAPAAPATSASAAPFNPAPGAIPAAPTERTPLSLSA